jgi:hypothetical protein
MFIVTILTMLYNGIIRTPKAKQVEVQLEREFNSVAPFPQATATHSEKSYKDAQALILTRYSTSASYSVLRDYYDTELSKHGWRFVSEQPLPTGAGTSAAKQRITARAVGRQLSNTWGKAARRAAPILLP